MMYEDFTADLERAAEKKREYRFEDGTRYILTNANEYGLWEISRKDKKKLPEILKGSFTSYHQAEIEINKYEQERLKIPKPTGTE